MNDEPQITPTQIIVNENDEPEISPTQIIENENDESQISPTQIAEIEKTINVNISTPVLINDLFMGGLSNGKWMQQEEFFNSGAVNLDGFEYDVYTNNMNMGTAFGRQPTNWMSGEPIQSNKYEEGFCIVELYDENNQAVSYDIAIKAEWNLFPRIYIEQNTKQVNYFNIIKNYLIEYGIENPETSIKQIISVDLEGDGIEEMLIVADNTIDDQFEQVKKGDNAVLVFRKVVDGEVIDQIVEQDIKLEEDDYPSLYRLLFRVGTIADLDGDSVMEVIVRNWYYEGEEWIIYKLIDNRLELVASNGLGA